MLDISTIECPATQLDPSVAKTGGLQSQGVKSEAVVSYRNPLATQDLKSSGNNIILPPFFRAHPVGQAPKLQCPQGTWGWRSGRTSL